MTTFRRSTSLLSCALLGLAGLAAAPVQAQEPPTRTAPCVQPSKVFGMPHTARPITVKKILPGVSRASIGVGNPTGAIWQDGDNAAFQNCSGGYVQTEGDGQCGVP